MEKALTSDGTPFDFALRHKPINGDSEGFVGRLSDAFPHSDD